MKDSSLLKLALICSIIGVIVLFFILQTTELEESNISELDDGVVRIRGFVEKVTNKGNLTLITISKKELVNTVIFESVEIQEGLFVDLIGQVMDYNGEKEIIIDKLVFIDQID
ncbi:hypothetical protein H8D36_07530 [archaeon]|nr:hypothetical protein [archaeon]MBL7057631.1 hypothetical protein [Candidatus Woesearchaeota archaeon]